MVKIRETHGYTLKDIQELERNTRQVRLRLRLMAIRLVWEGYPATAVGHILGLTGETVSTYVQAWNAGGPPIGANF